MSKRFNGVRLKGLTFIVALLCLVATAAQAIAGDARQVKRGAQLYDKWYAGGDAPAGSHPLYPAAGAKQGASSWRCKECHGWDYLGVKGRYAKGSHFTGIDGLLDLRGAPLDDLQKSLSHQGHDFTAFLSSDDLQALALFLREGTIDVTSALDAGGQALGSAAAGQPLYRQHCADCHGVNGNSLDFKGKKEGVQGVGWLARGNPQESLHKIRWGHPGSDMPSMISDARLSEQQVIDLLAYSQQLP